MSYRTHPLEILTNMWKFMYLIIIPIGRGLLLALQGHTAFWLAGIWKDLLVLGFIVGLSVLRWYNYTITIDNSSLEINQGLFFRRKKIIPIASICTVSRSSNIFLRPLKVVGVTCDTSAGKKNGVEFKVRLSPHAAESIFAKMAGRRGSGHSISRSYTPKNIYVILLSAITSNSLTGILIIAAFISQSGKILGEQFADRIYGTFEVWTRALAFGIPPAAAGLGYIVIFGWIFTFCRNLISNTRFEAATKQGILHISSGLIVRRSYAIDTARINYIDIKQTLYTKVLGLSSVFVHTFGYGKETDDIAALIPAASRKQLAASIALLLPGIVSSDVTLRPSKKSIMRFLWNPLILLGVSLLGALIAGLMLPLWKELIGWLGLMGVLLSGWFLVVRMVDWYTSGIGLGEDCMTLCYSKGFSLHRVVIPLEKVTMIKSVQSVFQIMDKNCDLYIYSYSEGIKTHRIRNVKLEAARGIMQSV